MYSMKCVYVCICQVGSGPLNYYSPIFFIKLVIIARQGEFKEKNLLWRVQFVMYVEKYFPKSRT